MNILAVVSVICLAVCLLGFIYLKWYIKKRTASSAHEETKEELALLIADVHRITDMDSQLVEDRIKKLKDLLYDVDKRIALYEKDLENLAQIEERLKKSSPRNEPLYTSLGRGIRAALNTPERETPLVLNPPAELNERNTPQIAAVSAPRININDYPPRKNQIRVHIDTLADEGLAPDEIAKCLNISMAEVNLAMELRRKN